MDAQYPSLSDTLSKLSPVVTGDLREDIRQRVSDPSRTLPLLVVLDDDPTGTQTCHDILVLTRWDHATLITAFTSKVTTDVGGFFVLTNSRALHPPNARSLIIEICKNLQAASKECGKQWAPVLRSDSTLRGHYPLEADACEEALGVKYDAWILAPFFLQGGRYTIDDVHYVADGDKLVPAGDTPFAKDASFGYKSSNLKDWVVEKSKGEISREKVVSLSLEDIRTGGSDKVADLLMSFPKGAVIIVNAAAESDMDVVTLGIFKAIEGGKIFGYRSGAALVSSRLGIKPIPPKTADSLHMDKKVGGLIIAGSYVPKTTSQLNTLIEKSKQELTTITLDVSILLKSSAEAASVVRDAVKAAEAKISKGYDVLIMTSRELVKGKDEKESLDIGSVVAKSLVDFLTQLSTRPRYIIAKGGITSSDMATKGLEMRIATVVGQAAPGVPLWECFEDTSKWAGIPFIVFPGNVGTDATLFEVVKGWRAS